MSGTASLSMQWDSHGFAAGDYAVEITLRDGEGNVLDRESEGFRLGVVLAEVVSLTATPDTFSADDVIDLSLVVHNAGDLPLEGLATIEVQTADGLTVTGTFTQAIATLAAGADTLVSAGWDTSGVAEAEYRVVGYVRYDSTATPPEVITLGAERRVYLPLVLRNAP
jgi:hypothetical protein